MVGTAFKSPPGCEALGPPASGAKTYIIRSGRKVTLRSRLKQVTKTDCRSRTSPAGAFKLLSPDGAQSIEFEIPGFFCRSSRCVAAHPDGARLKPEPFGTLPLDLTEPNFTSPHEGSALNQKTFEDTTAIWLILPVVICLSQRLSHACLSTSLS